MSRHTNSEAETFPGDLLLELRPAAGRTKALQLTQGLRSAIVSGRLLEGTMLPPSRVLARELGVSRSVVVQAFTDLVADGYLEARQGAGTRVRSEPRDAAEPAAGGAVDPVALDPSLLRVTAPLRLLGGLADPALFPRALWARHYRAALTELPDPGLGYPDSRGAEPLREAVAAYLGRVRGVLTTPDRVLVCAGVTQGIVLICRALRRAGAERVALEDPCFGIHRDAVAATGLAPIPVPGDGAGMDVALLPDVDAVLVAPAHSYPRGGTLASDRRRALIAWAREHDALVIEDDYDAELRYDRTPIAALQGRAPDHVAYVGSISKTFSPALRLGWVAAPARLVGRLEREKRLDDMGSSLFEQLALARLLDKGELARHLRRVRPVYRRRRDAALAAVARHLPDARPHGAAAGLHLYLELPGDVDMRALRRGALERGVLVEDAAPHWADPAAAPPALVLGYGSLPASAAPHALAQIAGVLAEISGRPAATSRTRSARRPAAATSRARDRA